MARKKKGRRISGWLILNKPYGMGSTQAVGKVKWLFQAQKAGHAGTLDPLATGMLPIALGEATKTVNYVMDGMKTYRFSVTWGVQTSTDDTEGEAINTSDKRPNKTEIEELIKKYHGLIEQLPPIFSALKINGKRAYDLARNGEEVVLKPREVFIDRFELIEMPDADTTIFELECSKGTYVRSFARDMGIAFGCFGHISALHRVNVNPFHQDEMIDLEDLIQLEGDFDGLDKLLISTGSALADLPSIDFPQDATNRIRLGNSVLVLGKDAPLAANEICATHNGDVVAIGVIKKGMFQPKRVFNL
jgi:tRNA pseudouridine55 synthase